MDATQMISDSIVESDEEEQEEGNNNNRGDPLGKLWILKNEHIPKKEFPLFLGDNILGRDPNTCTLSLPAPSVSKQHATISLSVYRRKGCENHVEALIWDLGSMNGTRKGHFKLTPNVRYALSERDCLMVADIPCKYMKCPVDVSKDTRTPVTQNIHLQARLSDTLGENLSNLITGKTKSTSISTKTKDPLPDSEVMRRTPAKTSCLSFKQTPLQPQVTLVPDSESESDEERFEVGDKQRKTVGSDSDCYKSSPACSTFMSPTNKVVPESEDESPITPSSSFKNRTHRVVSFNSEESDMDINRQELKKRVVLEIVDDSEEEAGNDKAGSALEVMHDKSGQPVLVKEECNASLTEGSNISTEADDVPQFNIDSDTDVEEEEEKLTSAVLVTSNNGQNSAQFHMDSDTDVDDNDSDKCSDPVLLSSKHSLLAIPVLQPKDSNMDSDTDVEDVDLLSAATAKPTVENTTEDGASTNPNDFEIDSDTDADEEETDIKGETPSSMDIKPVESTSAATQSQHLDSDTDNEEILSTAISKPPIEFAKNYFEILSNGYTNVEPNSPQVKPATSKPTVVEGQKDTDEDPDVNESIVSPTAKGNSDVALYSDSNVEYKDAEIIPGIQVSILQNCSTPVQLPEGTIEEMETQAFLSPSLPDRIVAAAPGRTFSSCLDSQDDDDDDDFAVAETQSFILNDRGQDNPLKDPNMSSDLESPVNEKNVSCTSEGNFQLELSDSSVLHCQAQALAMESTQNFVGVDNGVNLEETQPYAEAITTDKELPVDLALQATQPYISDPYSDEDEETDEDKPTEQVMGVPEAVTSSTVPESKHDGGTEEEHGEATQPADVLTLAETQPMNIDDESDSEESGPVFRKRKLIEEEEPQLRTNSELTVAKTQPMDLTEETGSDDDSPVFRKKKAKRIQEEETQPETNLELTAAETQPVEVMEDTESDEDSPVFKKKGKQVQEGETRSLTNSEPTETQPMEIMENSGSDEDSPVFMRRKAKQLQPEEEATQPIEMSKDEQIAEDEDFECTVAQTQLIVVTEESGGEDVVSVERKRQTKQSPPEKDIAVAMTQLIVLSEDMASDEEGSFLAPKKRKAQQLEDTQQLLSNSETDAQGTKPTVSKESERPDESENSNVNVTRRRGGARLGKDKQKVTEEVRSEPSKRQTKGKKKALPVSLDSQGKAKVEKDNECGKDRGAEDIVELQKKVKVKEEMEGLEKGKIEQEEKEAVAKIQQAKAETQQEILAHEKRMEKELQEKEEIQRRDKKRIEQEKETAAKIQQEKEGLEKAEGKARLEEAKIAGGQEGRKIQVHITRLELEEKGQLEGEKQEKLNKIKEEDQVLRRGRSTARRSIAAPDSSTAAIDDVPARRTRSRSNSSNSVASERSASSISSQTGRGRGRGRGARRTEVQAEKTPCRGSTRRKTMATVASIQVTEVSAPLPNSNSFNCEVSVSSVSSQRGGRGGRRQGRSRRTEAAPECVTVQSDQVTTENTPQRGRKSPRICSKDDKCKTEKSKQSISTRGQGGALDEESYSYSPDHEEDQKNQKNASTSGTEIRNVRKKQTENDGKNKSDTKGQEAEEEEEEKDVNPTVKRKAGARNTKSRKSEAKGRNQPSVAETSSEQQGHRGSSGSSSMEQETNPAKQEQPQTPSCTVSRKRHSADSDSSPVPKTHRSTSASPSSVGRARAVSHSYKVLFTGVVDELGQKVLSRLGGSIAKDVADMNCLVTDKVRRTVKFLCAVAKGVPIVTTQWLEKSGKAGTFLCTSAYLIKDREQEHKFNFNLQDSLRVANSQPLLKGYKIYVTKSVQPEPVHMKEIISCSGALFLPRMPSSKKPQTLVISCEEDWSLCGPAVSSAIPCLSAEFILTGILQQKLDFETHKLSGPVASAQATGGRGRGWKKI